MRPSGVASGTPRSEVSFFPVFRFVHGRDYAVRWSTVIPADYRFDSRQPELVAQLHQGGSGGASPFALLLNDGKYEVDVRGAPGMSSWSRTGRMPCRFDEGVTPPPATPHPFRKISAYALNAGTPPRCAYSTFDPGSNSPRRTLSIIPCIDFPS